MRIGFFYPESLSTIIKNEAHIRFSSSMWYGFAVIIKLLYFAIVLFILFETIINYRYNINEASNSILFVSNIFLVLIVGLSVLVRYGDNRIFEFDHKYQKELIDKKAKLLTNIYRIYDFMPFFVSFIKISIIYTCIYFGLIKEANYFFLLMVAYCFISIISFIIFYTKQKIELSFHYQRVREIIHVIEISNIAKVIKESDVRKLLSKRNSLEEVNDV